MNYLPHNKPQSLVLGSTVEGNKLVTLTGIDFERHKTLSGVSGSGKSTFIAWIAVSLLRQSIPFILIDPHGSLAKLILSLLATSDYFRNPKAYDRLWYVDFKRAEKDAAIAFNVLRQPSVNTHTVASNFLEALHRAFPTTGTTATLDNVIEATCYVLAETNQPVTQLSRILLDAPFREMLLRKISHPDPLIIQFFKSKFEEKASSQLIDSTLRRSFLLTFSPVLRNILSQQNNNIDYSYIFKNKISCLFSLGGLDDSTKRLIACLLLVSLEQKFLSMTDIPSDKKTPVHLIVDEAPVFFSQSESSFTTMLEQARKAGATLYYAFQTYSQLSKGMAGSLQNAISIIMKAGVDDSSTLAGRYYRPVEQEQPFDFFGFSPASPGLFANIRNLQEARMIFERLQRQEAIVFVSDKPVKILTPTLPIKIDQKKLEAIENEYARRLLTPLSQIEREQTRSNLVLMSSASATIKRRTSEPSQKQSKPLELFTGDLEQDILTAITHFHYLTLDQLTILLGKKKGNKNYLRKKLNTLIERNELAVTLLPRVSGGKPLQVYFAAGTGERKHQFLEHTLDCSAALVAGFQVPTIEPSLTLTDLKHERTLKATLSPSLVIPDGLLFYQTQSGEIITLALEIDRSTENMDRIEQKYRGYPSLIKRIGLESLTIAFLVTTGDRGRVSTLMQRTKDTIGESDLAPLFLFAAVPVEKITPHLYLHPVFTGLDTSPHALIEKPF